MTEQEKKLVSLMCNQSGYTNSDEGINDHIELAKEIIKAFPQITKKPVPIYKINDEITVLLDKRFAKEDERQAWIDSHYVEVISE